MDDKKPSWKKFQNLNIDRKSISKRARKAEGATTRHAKKFILRRVSNLKEVRHHILFWLILVGCLIVTAGLQMLWFQDSYSRITQDEGGTYAEGIKGTIETLNPLFATTDPEIAASKLIFSSLLDYDQTGHLRGALATSVEPNEKGDVYTVKLNPTVRWHDGTRLTAQDVVFTVDLIKNPETRSQLYQTWQGIKAVVVDDFTVKFELPSAYAAFPHALTLAILPKHILGEVDPAAIRQNTFSLNPVGSGPFRFRLLQSSSDKSAGHEIVSMSAFSDFYRGKAKLNRFEIHAFSTPELIASALSTNQINASVDSAQVEKFMKNPKYSVSSHPLNNGVYAFFNTTKDPLNDQKVRRALQLSVDTKSLRDRFLFEPPELDLPFVNGQIQGNNLKGQPYNKEEAAKLLDSAGWTMTNGSRTKGGKKLALNLATIKNEDFENAIENLAGDWRDLGVEVITSIYDTSNSANSFGKDVLQPRNFDVLIYELTIGADPDVYAYWHSSQTGETELNFSNYSNGLADDTLVSARQREDVKLRDLKYEAFSKQWLSDVPAIGLYQPTMTYIHSNQTDSITDNQKLIQPTHRYWDVIYWTVEQKQVYNTP